MKTLYILILIIFISSFAGAGFIPQTGKTSMIYIESADKAVSTEALTKSAAILSKRLKDYNPGESRVTVNSEKKRIEISVNGSVINDYIKNLVTKRGAAGFYETIDHSDLALLLGNDTAFFSQFTKKAASDSPLAGCVQSKDFQGVSTGIASKKSGNGFRLAWSDESDSGERCLYALRTDSKKGAAINGSELAEASFSDGRIMMTLKPESVKKWAELTRKNLGRVVAVVLDDEVIYSPVVKTVIDSGKLELTGNFTNEEARYIASMLNNGELPSEFLIVK